MSKIAFLFPGQGSQSVGMGKDIYNKIPASKELYDKANEILGFNIASISFEGPEEELKQTQYTQPALYIHSLVLAAQLEAKGVHAQAAAGHSLGEFSALAYGHGFSFEDGLSMVKERGRLMQSAGDSWPGSMAAIIGLDAETVMSICVDAQSEGVVQPANYNSPQQIVISGSREGVARAMVLAKEKKAKRVMQLPVSGAFHSPLMASAVEDFGRKLEETNINFVGIPVYANVTANPVSSVEEIRNLLHHQLTHPVRWVETIENMIHDGVSIFIEVGAGKVLSGLVKRIDREVTIKQCGTFEDLEQF